MQMTRGPETGIDNINCTGIEQRLVDCSISLGVGDCKDEEHKVGLKCHEESMSVTTNIDKGKCMNCTNSLIFVHVQEYPEMHVDS